MNFHRVITALALLATLVGCATSPSRPTRTEFEDIPVPRGLSYQPGMSLIIESPSVKAARSVYRGRIEVESLAVATRNTLEANGWRQVSSTTPGGSKQGITQVYEKGGNSLQVLLYEGIWYTYLEYTASRALAAPR